MKQLLLIITIVFFALQVKAQLIKDEWGTIIPFSSVEDYKEIIEAYDIPGHLIPYMDNDSLSKKYNNGKTIEELDAGFIGGIDLPLAPISIKENAVCIKLKQGKLWRYAIEGTSASSIGFDLGFPKISKGGYIAIIPADTTIGLIQQTKIFHSENLLKRHREKGLRGTVFGKKLIIEYFEPNTLRDKEDIIIERISYGFVGFGGSKTPASGNAPKLKSGFWGDSNYSQCLQDVVCSSYLNEAKSVVFLYAIFKIDEDEDGYFENHYYKATGFFLNKEGGYSDTDSPLLVTAGHLYSYEKFTGETIDIINSITDFYVISKYQNIRCGVDDTDNRGIELPGSFNRISLGNSYDQSGLPWHSPNEDYALLQASSNILQLSHYNLVYSAWSKNHDFNSNSNVDYFCIHHPKGDVKKINKDNDPASSVRFDRFGLKYDTGLTEGGSSGAPVFNSSKEIVGFHVGSSKDKGCDLVGQIETSNGTFTNLYHEFSSILDPNNAGEAPSSNPQPPSYSELPSHCKNCVQDGDETGIDCGGSCYPCGVRGDVVAIKNEKELIGSVKSRYEIFAEPDPGTLLCLKSGYSSLEAGMNVHLKGGFEVQKGAVFYANVEPELMSVADRGCQPACVHLANIFTPNGDGLHDFWGFDQAFVTSYDLLIWDRYNKTMYSANNQPVYDNETILAWDGAGTVSGGVYYGRLTYRDCYGNTHVENFFTHVFKDKSAKISEEREPDEMKVTDVAETSIAQLKLKVFPNPVDNYITIDYNGKEFPIEYRLTAINGKLILHEKSNISNVKIDMSDLPSGAYILNAKAGNYNLIEKLIKN